MQIFLNRNIQYYKRKHSSIGEYNTNLTINIKFQQFYYPVCYQYQYHYHYHTPHQVVAAKAAKIVMVEGAASRMVAGAAVRTKSPRLRETKTTSKSQFAGWIKDGTLKNKMISIPGSHSVQYKSPTKAVVIYCKEKQYVSSYPTSSKT